MHVVGQDAYIFGIYPCMFTSNCKFLSVSVIHHKTQTVGTPLRTFTNKDTKSTNLICIDF